MLFFGHVEKPAICLNAIYSSACLSYESYLFEFDLFFSQSSTANSNLFPRYRSLFLQNM